MGNRTLNELATECHSIAVQHGFWDHMIVDGKDNRSIWPEKIALIHSEASEMLDALRSGNESELILECADLMIRLLDFCGARKIDIEDAVQFKMAVNREREYLHGRKF